MKDTLEVLRGTSVTLNLGKSRNPGAYHISEFILRNDAGKLVAIDMHMRTWAYNAHMPQQDIQELRKLIEV